MDSMRISTNTCSDSYSHSLWMQITDNESDCKWLSKHAYLSKDKQLGRNQ